MNGPYQMCLTCKTERNHKWVNETHYACNACGSTHKIVAKIAKPVELEHIEPELAEELTTLVHSETIPEVKEVPKEVKPEIHTILNVELPKQGHEIKPTPLENYVSSGMKLMTVSEIQEAYKGQLTAKEKNALKAWEAAETKLDLTLEEISKLEMGEPEPIFIPEDHGTYIIDRENREPDVAIPPKNLDTPGIGRSTFTIPFKKGWASNL